MRFLWGAEEGAEQGGVEFWYQDLEPASWFPIPAPPL